MTQAKPYTVIVGIDFEANGDLALDAAIREASLRNGEVHAIHVAHVWGPQPNMDATLVATTVEEATKHLKAHLESRLSLYVAGNGETRARVIAHVGFDSPAIEIAQLASDLEADLVVVGTHGRRGLTRAFLGSVAEATVRLAPCTVLVVKAEPPPPAQVIEPACPRCVTARRESKGETLWCAQHQERHGRRHTYNFIGRTNRQRESLPGLGSDD